MRKGSDVAGERKDLAATYSGRTTEALTARHANRSSSTCPIVVPGEAQERCYGG
jgi:hypothetical protein